MKTRAFYNDTFRFSVHLVWPVTSLEFRDFVRKTCDAPGYQDPGDFTAMCHTDPHDVVIGFKNWTGSDKDMGSLAHESMHAAQGVLEDLGVVLTDETSECYAYLLETIFDRSLRLLRGKKA